MTSARCVAHIILSVYTALIQLSRDCLVMFTCRDLKLAVRHVVHVVRSLLRQWHFHDLTDAIQICRNARWSARVFTIVTKRTWARSIGPYSLPVYLVFLESRVMHWGVFKTLWHAWRDMITIKSVWTHGLETTCMWRVHPGLSMLIKKLVELSIVRFLYCVIDPLQNVQVHVVGSWATMPFQGFCSMMRRDWIINIHLISNVKWYEMLVVCSHV